MWGAESVLGVDVSPKMIELAIKQEDHDNLGIKYVVEDALTLSNIGEFGISFFSPRCTYMS